MSLYEFLKGLSLVPANLVLALLIGLLVLHRWRRLGYGILWASLIVFYLLSAPLTAGKFARALETVPPLTDLSAAHDAQAIVVLSAGANNAGVEYGGILLDSLSTMRLRYAAHLYRELKLPILVTGGTVRNTGTSLGAAMKQALEQDFSVPVTWVEDRAANTGANARLSADILRKANVHKIVLVTHALHMPRAVELFRDTGLEVIPAPTAFTNPTPDLPWDLLPTMSSLQTSYYSLYEAAGQIWYRIRPTPAPEDDVTPVIPTAN